MAKNDEKKDMQSIDVRILRRMWPKGGAIKTEEYWGIYEVELMSGNKDNTTTENTIHIFRTTGETTIVTGAFNKEFFYGEEYTMYGHKEYNEKYRNDQWKIISVENKLNTPDKVRAFMMACTKNKKVVDQLMTIYGDDLIEAITENRVDVNHINGLGEKSFENLREKVLENIYMKEIIAELSQYDVTPNQMKKVMLRFGSQAVDKIKENPYNLCKIRGIGFRKADVIAQKMGFSDEHPSRIKECIKYVLEEAQKQGHTWMQRNDLVEECQNLLSIPSTCIEDQIRVEVGEEVYISEIGQMALKHTYEAEKFIAERLLEIQEKSQPLNIDVDTYAKTVREQNPTITDEQISILYNFAKNGVSLLIGNAGTGKSFSTKMLINMVRNNSILLLAPTGKASKVLSNYTGMEASTIHRAIGMWGSDEDDEEDVSANNQLYADMVDEDEGSMADVFIQASLLKALQNPNVRILITGDDFQIPSVGAGNVLHDMIQSGKFATTKLTKVFRQAEGGILDIATKVRLNEKFMDNDFPLNLPIHIKDEDGNEIPNPKLWYGKDMVIHPVAQEYMYDGIMEYYKEALKKYSPDEIVVLSPTKLNNLGTRALNKAIQEIVNPNLNKLKKEIVYGKDEKTAVIFREGDRVINIKNNYHAHNIFEQETTVYNGDMGVIKEISTMEGYLVVDYGFENIKMSTKNLDTLSHAYALTIHKMQGSSAKCVILVTDKAHKFQLNANLVYTGITRATDMCYWLCQPDVINHSMNKNMPDIRNTFLYEMLTKQEEGN